MVKSVWIKGIQTSQVEGFYIKNTMDGRTSEEQEMAEISSWKNPLVFSEENPAMLGCRVICSPVQHLDSDEIL